jgi:hypothetical protein
MSSSFLRGAVVGLVCALLGGAAVALAASGIGGVFNLGVSNSVNAKTSLTGSTAAAQLQVTNTSTTPGAAGLGVASASSSPTATFTNSSTGIGLSATSATGTGVLARTGGSANPSLSARNTGGGLAASFTVNSGLAPFAVSSQTKVPNLNADMVDGFHVNQIMSGGGRVAQASTFNLFWPNSTDTQATVALTAPNNGFVFLQGTIVFTDDFGTKCTACYGVVRVHDVSANADSPPASAEIGNGTVGQYTTIPVQWVFPVTAGSHSYALTTWQNPLAGGPASFSNPVLTAEFIPFGHNGSSTILAPDTENTVAAPTKTNADGSSRGSP